MLLASSLTENELVFRLRGPAIIDHQIALGLRSAARCKADHTATSGHAAVKVQQLVITGYA